MSEGHHNVVVTRLRGGVVASGPDTVATEVPVALVYNGVSHVVMMATPQNLEDFALGFSLTEGIIHDPAELYDIEPQQRENGIELQLKISERCFQNLKAVRRNMAGRTGCGLCGAESLEQAIRLPSPLQTGSPVATQAVVKAMNALPAHQAINQLTGATHAAAWADSHGNIVEVREDVGRHNALDKLIGALSKQQRPPGFLLVTSRASYEMVQKAGWADMGLVAAVSAPTSLAIELAEQLNITLLGFVREENFVIYANPEGVIGI